MGRQVWTPSPLWQRAPFQYYCTLSRIRIRRAMVGAIVLPVRHYPKYTLHRSVRKAEILDTY